MIIDNMDGFQGLEQVKSDIKDAIEEKGGYVEGGLSSYPAAISRLKTGSKLYVVDGMSFCYSSWVDMPEEIDFTYITTTMPYDSYNEESGLFAYCENLVRTSIIDVSNFESISYMFYECYNLEECYFKGDPSKIKSAIKTFYDYQYGAKTVTVYYDEKYKDQWNRIFDLILSQEGSDNKKDIKAESYNYDN